MISDISPVDLASYNGVSQSLRPLRRASCRDHNRSLDEALSTRTRKMAIPAYREKGMLLPTKLVTRKPFDLVIPLIC
jgi:hypothetical protein